MVYHSPDAGRCDRRGLKAQRRVRFGSAQSQQTNRPLADLTSFATQHDYIVISGSCMADKEAMPGCRANKILRSCRAMFLHWACDLSVDPWDDRKLAEAHRCYARRERKGGDKGDEGTC